MSDARPESPAKSLDELLAQLADELSLLLRSDLELAAAEHAPRLRRLALELAAVLPAALAAILALAALSWAGVQGLGRVMPSWCASLVVAACWGLASALMLAGDHPRRFLRRLAGGTSVEAVGHATAERAAAEQALRATAEELARAVAREAAERELHASVDGAEALVGSAEHEGEDLLKELLVSLLAPGKAGLSLLEEIVGRRSRRAGG